MIANEKMEYDQNPAIRLFFKDESTKIVIECQSSKIIQNFFNCHHTSLNYSIDVFYFIIALAS